MRLNRILTPHDVLPAILIAVLLGPVLSVAAEQPLEPLAYTVEFTGLADGELRTTLEAVSVLVGRRDRPPASVRLLERRAQQDLVKLEQALRALGHYAPTLSLDIDDRERPVQARITVEPGPPYLIRSAQIRSASFGPVFDRQLPSAYDLGLKLQDPLISRVVLDAENRLLETLRRRGYPFAAMADREVLVDHRHHCSDLTLTVEPGPAARFGNTTFTGAESVAEEFLLTLLPWRPGNPTTPTSSLRRAPVWPEPICSA